MFDLEDINFVYRFLLFSPDARLVLGESVEEAITSLLEGKIGSLEESLINFFKLVTCDEDQVKYPFIAEVEDHHEPISIVYDPNMHQCLTIRRCFNITTVPTKKELITTVERALQVLTTHALSSSSEQDVGTILNRITAISDVLHNTTSQRVEEFFSQYNQEVSAPIINVTTQFMKCPPRVSYLPGLAEVADDADVIIILSRNEQWARSLCTLLKSKRSFHVMDLTLISKVDSRGIIFLTALNKEDAMGVVVKYVDKSLNVKVIELNINPQMECSNFTYDYVTFS